jgi:hypothetical protein
LGIRTNRVLRRRIEGGRHRLVRKIGGYPAADPQKPENMAATIYDSLGIPAAATWHDDSGRPHNIYYGTPIAGL